MLNITETEIANRLKLDNPWWENGQIEERFANLQRRTYFDELQGLVTNRSINRAVVLMGPRRVGKTVLAYHSIVDLLDSGVPAENILYLSLETPVYIGLALEKLTLLFTEKYDHNRNSELYIYFDEIQYLKDWEIHLKSLVDTFPNYRFVATGSAAAALRLKSQESGAGRFTDFTLPPLTFYEFLLFTEQKESLIEEVENVEIPKDIPKLNEAFINYINYGGYPETALSETIKQDPARFIKNDIIDKVLLRDLPSLYGIRDIQELNRLFTVLAYNTGQEVSLDKLSTESNIAKNTLKRYIEYLEAAFLIKIVHRVDQNAKRLKRATCFKVYLTNPSMRAALFGTIGDDSESIGALVETAIYSQLFHGAFIDEVYYARWKKGEVDIVFLNNIEQRPGTCIEIKWSDLPCEDNRKISSLIDFLSKNGLTSATVTSKTLYASKNINNYNISFMPSVMMAYVLSETIYSKKLNRNRNIFSSLEPKQE